MKLLILLLSLTLFGCGSLLKSAPQINTADFYITTISSTDTTCIKEHGLLFIDSKVFNTEVEVRYEGTVFSIYIPKAIRSQSSSYSYSGYADDGSAWDVTIGTKRDAIIAFKGGPTYWKIIDYKCFFKQ
jgi:hypothetical protein